MEHYDWIIGVIFCILLVIVVISPDAESDPELDQIRDQAGMF